jgi:hypothetical protein
MQYVRSLLEKRIDGIVMNSVSMLSREQQVQLASSGVPILLLNRAASNHVILSPPFAPTTKREALWRLAIFSVSVTARSLT